MAKTKTENLEKEEVQIEEQVAQEILQIWNFPDYSFSVEAADYQEALKLCNEILQTKTENN